MNLNPVLLISKSFQFIFGTLHWQGPLWLQWLKKSCQALWQKHPRVLLWVLLLLGAAGLSGYVIDRWYEHLPKPQLTDVSIELERLDKIPLSGEPLYLKLNFIKEGAAKDDYSAFSSVAPLGSDNHDVEKNIINLTPATPGTWHWESGSFLTFYPDHPWIAGQKYKITFSKKALAPSAHLTKKAYQFTTPPFTASITRFKYQQDEVDPNLQQLVATLNFNYPVQEQSTSDHIQLAFQDNEKQSLFSQQASIPFTLSFSADKQEVYLRSSAIPFAKFPRFARLVVQPGIRGLTNQATTKTSVAAQTAIPDANTLFQITAASAQIASDHHDIPHQVLIFETSLGVSPDALTKALHVFLLPKNNPAVSVDAEDDNDEEHDAWQNPGEVTQVVLAHSTPVTLTPIASGQAYPRMLSYQFKAPQDRFLYIKVDQGVQSFGHFLLANPYFSVVKAPQFPQEIRFEHSGSVLSLGSVPQLSVLSRGVPAVHFQIARVLPDMLNQLITQTEGDFNNPQFIHQHTFNSSNISQVYDEVQQLNNSDPSQEQYTSLDFKKYLAKRLGKLGLFLLTADDWNIEKKEPVGDVSAKRLILVTDLAFLVKTNVDNTHDVFVTSISTGKPAAHAHIEVLGKNGLPIISANANEQGHALLPSLQDDHNDKAPIIYRVSLGSDVSFMPYKRESLRLNYSRFDTDGISSTDVNDEGDGDTDVQKKNSTLMAEVFTERGIYRPGETIHIGAIVKGPYGIGVPAGLPIACTIDHFGAQVFNTILKTDAVGLVSVDYTLSDTAETGDYYIRFSLPGKKQNKNSDDDSTQIGSAKVDVEEFLPDTLRVNSHFEPITHHAWVAPNQMTALIQVQNLFGMPSVNTDVRGTMQLIPEALDFKNFPNYIFTDPDYLNRDDHEPTTQVLNPVTTDSNGIARFPLDLQNFLQASYRLVLESKAFVAGGGRSVSNYNSIFVSPRPYFIGYKTDNDLSYLGLHTKPKINLLAVDATLHAINLNHLHWALTRQEEIVTLVKKEDGSFAYQLLKQWKPVRQGNDFNLSDQGSDFPLFTDETGYYQWQLMNEKDLVISELHYTVAGQSAGNTQLNVTLNKKEYLPGETILLNIAAPYTGTGLITIERDKVYTYQWFKTSTPQSVQKIVLPKAMKGNAYVTINFMRDFNSPDIFSNPLSYSVKPIKINPAAQNVPTHLSVPEQIKPGTDLTIHYQTNQPAKIIVYAVDQGILSVTPHFALPNPLEFFFQKRALEVFTTQIIDQILPKFIKARELSAVGGDDEGKTLNTDFNPFKRKQDAPVVYWSGIISADQKSRSVMYHVPDYFNGSLRVVAVAAAENAIGSSDATVIVRNDYVITAHVPTFVAPGDAFTINATVTNTLDTPVHGMLEITPHNDALTVSANTQQVIDLPARGEKTVGFKVKANAVLGNATITFDFKNATHVLSHMDNTLSIRPLSVYQTQLQGGYSANTQTEQAVHPAWYPQYRKLSWQVADTPLVLLSGVQHYLDNLPFACSEQLVSRLFPLLEMSAHPEWRDLPKNIPQTLQAGITELRARQLSDGSFTYWPHRGRSAPGAASPFASIYAVHFLTEAKATHQDIQDESLKQGINYLQEFVLKEPKNLDDARLMAYAAYVLTRNSVITTNVLTNLQVYLNKNDAKVWTHDIASAYIAASYALLQDQKTAGQLINGYQLGAAVTEENNFYTPESSDAQYLYLLTQHFPEQLNSLGGKAFADLAATLSVDRFSSLSAAYSLLAIEHYATPAVKNHLTLKALVADGGVGQSIEGTHWLTLDFAANTTRLLARSVPAGFFYQMTQAGFMLPSALKEQSHGLAVHAEYLNAAGKKITQVHIGDVVTVRVSARSPDKTRDQVALIDLLPGGFEWVQDSTDANNFSFTEAGEDRVSAYGMVGTDIASFTFKIRAVNTGHYQLPPAYAVAMYDPRAFAEGSVGSMDVIK